MESQEPPEGEKGVPSRPSCRKGDVIIAINLGVPIYGPPTPELPWGLDQFGNPLTTAPSEPRQKTRTAQRPRREFPHTQHPRTRDVSDPRRPKLPQVPPSTQATVDVARAKISELLTPVAARMTDAALPSLWIPRPDTLQGPFTDGVL